MTATFDRIAQPAQGAFARRLRFVDPSMILWIALIAVLVFLIASPMVRLIISSFQDPETHRLTLANYAEAYGRARHLQALWNTFQFGAGGWSNTEIEKVLPVLSSPKGYDRSLGLVILLDSSGSMAGFPIEYARKAVKEIIGMMRGRWLGVINFSHQVEGRREIRAHGLTACRRARLAAADRQFGAQAIERVFDFLAAVPGRAAHQHFAGEVALALEAEDRLLVSKVHAQCKLHGFAARFFR